MVIAAPLPGDRSLKAPWWRPHRSCTCPGTTSSTCTWTESDSDQQKSLLWEGHQLLLNYCYGHPDSSLLLLPDSPMVNLIRHYKNPTDKNEQPNVAIRWSATASQSRRVDATDARPTRQQRNLQQALAPVHGILRSDVTLRPATSCSWITETTGSARGSNTN